MDGKPALIALSVPAGTMADGAVVELQSLEENETGILYAAEIRIPGPPVP
jgi:hypothetical protein